MPNIFDAGKNAGPPIVRTIILYAVGKSSIQSRSDFLNKQDHLKMDRKLDARTTLDDTVQSINFNTGLDRSEKDRQLKQTSTRFTQRMSEIDAEISETEIEADIRISYGLPSDASDVRVFSTLKPSRGYFFGVPSKNVPFRKTRKSHHIRFIPKTSGGEDASNINPTHIDSPVSETSASSSNSNMSQGRGSGPCTASLTDQLFFNKKAKKKLHKNLEVSQVDTIEQEPSEKVKDTTEMRAFQGVDPNVYDVSFTTSQRSLITSSTLVVIFQFLLLYVVGIPICEVLQKKFRIKFLSKWDKTSISEEPANPEKKPLKERDRFDTGMRLRKDTK